MSIIVRSNEAANHTQTPNNESQPVVAESKETHSAPETKTSEQNESESETEKESEEDHSNLGDLEAVSEKETEEEQNEAKEKPKKKGGFQRRIDKLNAAKTAAQQEAEYWKKLALEKSAGEPKTESKTDSKSQTATEGKPNPEHFDSHAEYVEALTDWKTEQKLKEREQRAEKARLEDAQKNVAQSYMEKAKAFAKEHTDFDEVIAEADEVPVSPTVRSVILESENGPALAYELAKHPEELERISKLGPIAAAKELGKIEERLAKASSQKQGTKKITNAPNPLAPVGAGGKGSAPKSIHDPNLSQAEYERLRAEQKKRRQA